MPRHTAMSFKERIAEARRDKARRKSELAKKRKRALVRKEDRLGDGNSSSTVDEHANNFLDTSLDLLEVEDSQNVSEEFSIGAVTL